MTRTRKAVLGLLVALGTFTALELGLRVLFTDELDQSEAHPPAPQEGAPTMRGSPYLLWEQAPGVRSEHGVTASINSLGLRGPDPVLPKPRGVRRLLATGDSSVYGFGVGDDEPFIQVAARLLDVEGHNAAIPGYSTLQTINLLEMRALSLEPDVIVVANLWSDNNFGSFVDKELLSAYTRFERSPRARLERALQPLALYRLLHWRLVTSSEQAKARTVGWTVGGEPTGPRRVAVNDYAANIDRIAHMALDAGAELVFVVLPNQDDLVHDPNPKAWTVYRQVLRDAGERFGAPLVDGSSLFRGGEGLLLDEMHPTPEGHSLLGEELARVLEPWAAGGTVMGSGDGSAVPSYQDVFVYGDGGGSTATSVASVSGRLVWTHAGPLRVEAVNLAASSQPTVGGVRVDTPGPFTMELQGQLSRVGFAVTTDGGERQEFFDTPLDLSGGGEGLVLNLDAGQLQRDKPGP